MVKLTTTIQESKDSDNVILKQGLLYTHKNYQGYVFLTSICRSDSNAWFVLVAKNIDSIHQIGHNFEFNERSFLKPFTGTITLTQR